MPMKLSSPRSCQPISSAHHVFAMWIADLATGTTEQILFIEYARDCQRIVPKGAVSAQHDLCPSLPSLESLLYSDDSTLSTLKSMSR